MGTLFRTFAIKGEEKISYFFFWNYMQIYFCPKTLSVLCDIIIVCKGLQHQLNLILRMHISIVKAKKNFQSLTNNVFEQKLRFYPCQSELLVTNVTLLNLYRGWRELGNKTLQRSRVFGLVLFMRGVTDQEGRPAWQRQLGAGAGRESWSCSE